MALAMSRANTILLTDADCTMEPGWIERMLAGFRKQELALGFGPVRFTRGNSLLTSFQEIDLMAMMASTKWTIQHKIPMLGNAANMIFDKSTFLAVNGYANNIHLPSGDDIFLLDVFLKSSPRCCFRSIHTVEILLLLRMDVAISALPSSLKSSTTSSSNDRYVWRSNA